MRSFVKFTPLFVTLLVLGCVKGVETPQFHAPDLKMPKIPDLKIDLGGLSSATCNKKDSEMPLTKESLRTRLIINETIENKDLTVLDCDGKEISRTRGPEHGFGKLQKFASPADFKGALNYISVKNDRTCTNLQVQAKDQSNIKTELKLPDGKTVSLPKSTNLNLAGDLELDLTDSSINFTAILPLMNVREGLNVLEVRYLGKCLKYRDNAVLGAGDAVNCLDAEELATKSIIIDLKINRPDGTGTVPTVQCDKTKR